MRRLASFLAAAWAVAAACPARADGGYFSGTKGARAAGRAGSFTAKADDLSAVAFNPAGLARIDSTLIQAGNRVSYNEHVFRRSPTLDWGNVRNGVPPYVEFAEVRNRRPWQVLDPLLGVSSSLGLDGFGFALAAYAPAGVGRQEFPIGGGQRYMMVSREAQIINYAVSAAWHRPDSFGFGASLVWIHVPRLSYELVIDANVFPGRAHPVENELDMLSTITGSDPFTFNAVVGAWYRPVPFLELGVSGQVVPAQIETESRLSVDPLSPSEDVILRRDGQPANDVSLTLPLPLTARAGVRYRHLRGVEELFDVELDVVYETWSRVERFSVATDGLVATLRGQNVSLGLIEVEKRWRDTLGLHLGSDVAVVPDGLTLRGGLFYESAVAEPAYANVDFVGSEQLGGALGGSLFVHGFELAFAYEYRHALPISVSEGDARVFQEAPGSQCRPPYTDPVACHPRYLGRPAPAVNAGTYRAHSHLASLDVLYRF